MKNLTWVVISLAVAALLLSAGAVFVYFVEFAGWGLGDQEAFALFGDFTGGVVNPILGFFTILILVVSLLIQAQELKATREELAATKLVHQKSLEMKHREVLWPRLWQRFVDMEELLADRMDEKQSFPGFINGHGKSSTITTSLKQIAVQREIAALGMPGTGNKYEFLKPDFWEASRFKTQSTFLLTIFSELASLTVALIDYSDTSVEVDQVKNRMLTMLERFWYLQLIGDRQKNEIRETVSAAISERQSREAEFPYHKAIRFDLKRR